jgi:hypothetical protein
MVVPRAGAPRNGAGKHGGKQKAAAHGVELQSASTISVDQVKPVPTPPYSTPHNLTIRFVILEQNKFRVWTTKYEDAHPCSVSRPPRVLDVSRRQAHLAAPPPCTHV